MHLKPSKTQWVTGLLLSLWLAISAGLIVGLLSSCASPPPPIGNCFPHLKTASCEGFDKTGAKESIPYVEMEKRNLVCIPFDQFTDYLKQSCGN